MSRWLKNFGSPFVDVLSALNAEVVARLVKMFSMRVLTVDADGRVVSTGMNAKARAKTGKQDECSPVVSHHK